MQRAAWGADVTRTAVLALIGAQGPVSRAELARSLKVSAALVTQLTRQLIADNLLAKHDENYVPRELKDMTEAQKRQTVAEASR